MPSFVADNSDNLSSSHMDVGEMHTILNKIDKFEAILFGVQTAVYIVRMIIDQANAMPNRTADFLNKTNRFAQNESECSTVYIFIHVKVLDAHQYFRCLI